MNNITPIFKLADILHTPEGIAIGGAFSSQHQQLNDVLHDVKQSVDNLDSVVYLNTHQELVPLSIKEVQYTTSIGNGVNLFFLLEGDRLPDGLTEGTTIYQNQQTNTTLSAELSASSI